ncbi:MAG: HAD family phosphatase [Lachnospiraceae bacterium]|nr:HAD family phosphatase [Lachnospiraceae bacterium]
MIKNLIFDMGGVLIGYRWKEMLTEDFGVEEDRAFPIGEMLFEDPIWRKFDAGLEPMETVLEHYVELYPEDATVIRRMFYEGERMSVKRERVWDRVRELKNSGYKIYVLSNYSEYLFKKHTKDVTILPIMDGIVVSYVTHSIKPDHAIYRYLLDKYGLKAEECRFFDDNEDNVNAAKELGMEAVLITSEEMLLKELE